MRRKTWFIIIGLVGLLGFGVYAFCIPCQYFEYRSLPDVAQVLAQPSQKPSAIGEIWVSRYVETNEVADYCIDVKFGEMLKRDLIKDFYKDTSAQLWQISGTSTKTFKLFVDNYRRNVMGRAIAVNPPRSFSACVVDFKQIPVGNHVAYIEFDDPFGTHYSYTWVFEVTADGVVPEVRATAGR